MEGSRSPRSLPLVTQQAWKSGVSVFPYVQLSGYASWKGFLEARLICLQMFSLGFLIQSFHPSLPQVLCIYRPDPPAATSTLFITHSPGPSLGGDAFSSLETETGVGPPPLPQPFPFLYNPDPDLSARHLPHTPLCAPSGPTKIHPGLWTLHKLAALLFRPRFWMDSLPRGSKPGICSSPFRSLRVAPIFHKT